MSEPINTTLELFTENNSNRKYIGVKKFHDAGFFGEGINMATGEDWDINVYNPYGLVQIPQGNGYGYGNFTGEHGVKTAGTFFQIAPKAKLFQLPKIRNARTGKNCYCGLEDNCLDIIKENNILGVFCSFDMICDTYLAEKYTKVLDELQTFNYVVSAGNDYSESYCNLMRCDAVIGVGAYYLASTGGNPKMESFTSRYEKVDTSAPDRWTIKYDRPGVIVHEWGKTSGTSFSGPTILGMIALVNEFFIKNTGKPLHYKQMMQFIKDHCTDISDPGFDSLSGWGAFILPDPNEIVINKYQPEEIPEPTPPITPEKPEDEKEPEKMDMEKYKSFTKTEENNSVTILEIPYESIRKVEFDQCAQPKESVESYYKRQLDKPQIIINGGLFNMSSGTNILSFVNEGVEQNYQNGFEGIGTVADNPALLQAGCDNAHAWKDFMSAYPVLVRDGKAVTKFDKGNELNYYAARQAIGVKKDGSIIILTADKNGLNGSGLLFKEMANLFVKYGAEYAINLDGGGSVYGMIGGEVYNHPTEKRLVDNVFCVYLKEKDDDKPNTDPGVVTAPTVEPGEYYVTAATGLYNNVTSNLILADIPKNGKIKVTSTMAWQGKAWMIASYEYQYGFVPYTGPDCISLTPVEDKPVEPEVPEVPEPEYEFPSLWECTASALNVRSSPEIGNNIICTIERGDKIVADEIVDGWLVSNDLILSDPSNTAYMSLQYMKYLGHVEPEIPEVPEPEDKTDVFKIVEEQGIEKYTDILICQMDEDLTPFNKGEYIAVVELDADDVTHTILSLSGENDHHLFVTSDGETKVHCSFVDRVELVKDDLEQVHTGEFEIYRGSNINVQPVTTAGDKWADILPKYNVSDCAYFIHTIADDVYHFGAYIMDGSTITQSEKENLVKIDMITTTPETPEEPETPPVDDDPLDCFDDKDSIQDIFKDDVREMVRLGVFLPGEKFRPQDPLTREEAAAVMRRLMDTF